MPYKLIPVGRGKYKVTSPNGTRAKGTTLAKAKRQMRLLQGIEHNPKFAKQVRARAKKKK